MRRKHTPGGLTGMSSFEAASDEVKTAKAVASVTSVASSASSASAADEVRLLLLFVCTRAR